MSLGLADDGPGAPPRANGELVFDAPWQSRVFGLAATLAEAGRLEWSDFQQALISEVDDCDRAGSDTSQPEVYWRCWLGAFGAVAIGSGLVEQDVVSRRCVDLAAKGDGHG